MAKCLVDALDYLHNEKNIVHRDIKPANVLLDESGAPLLVDFGKAEMIVDNLDFTTSIEGSYTFLPPECCSLVDCIQDPYSMKKADVWSLGTTLYIITYNRFPYEFKSKNNSCMTELDIMDTIANFQLNFPEDGRLVSPDLKYMLSLMLEKDPSKRPDIGSIKKNCRFLNGSDNFVRSASEINQLSGSSPISGATSKTDSF